MPRVANTMYFHVNMCWMWNVTLKHAVCEGNISSDKGWINFQSHAYLQGVRKLWAVEVTVFCFALS